MATSSTHESADSFTNLDPKMATSMSIDDHPNVYGDMVHKMCAEVCDAMHPKVADSMDPSKDTSMDTQSLMNPLNRKGISPQRLIGTWRTIPNLATSKSSICTEQCSPGCRIIHGQSIFKLFDPITDMALNDRVNRYNENVNKYRMLTRNFTLKEGLQILNSCFVTAPSIVNFVICGPELIGKAIMAVRSKSCAGHRNLLGFSATMLYCFKFWVYSFSDDADDAKRKVAGQEIVEDFRPDVERYANCKEHLIGIEEKLASFWFLSKDEADMTLVARALKKLQKQTTSPLCDVSQCSCPKKYVPLNFITGNYV